MESKISEKDAQEVINKAKKNIDNMPENAGAYFCNADIVASVCEQTDWYKNPTDEKKKTVDYAIKKVREAVDFGDPGYAKGYIFLARLLAIKAEHDSDLNGYKESEKYARQAIDNEPSGELDYSMRVSDYSVHLVRIKTNMSLLEMRQQTNEIQTKLENFLKKGEKKIQDSLIKNIEFLSIFSGVITLLITGVTVVFNRSEGKFHFSGAAGALLILFGALIMCLFTFELVLQEFITGNEKASKSKYMNKIKNTGIILIGMGAVICFTCDFFAGWDFRRVTSVLQMIFYKLVKITCSLK